MKKLILLTLLSFSSYSFDIKEAKYDGLSFYQKMDLNDDLVTAVVFNSEGNHRFNFFDSSNKKTIDFSMAPTEGFLEAKVYSINNYKNPIIATTWVKGVHGKQVLIHDMKTGKQLLHIKSSFNLKVKDDANKLSIHWTGDTVNRIPKKHITNFPR